MEGSTTFAAVERCRGLVEQVDVQVQLRLLPLGGHEALAGGEEAARDAAAAEASAHRQVAQVRRQAGGVQQEEGRHCKLGRQAAVARTKGELGGGNHLAGLDVGEGEEQRRVEGERRGRRLQPRSEPPLKPACSQSPPLLPHRALCGCQRRRWARILRLQRREEGVD